MYLEHLIKIVYVIGKHGRAVFVGRGAKRIAIIGGEFIGAEFADEISQRADAEIHIIEIMPKLLLTAFDKEFCDQINEILIKAGVKVHTGNQVASIDGDKHVESVTFPSKSPAHRPPGMGRMGLDDCDCRTVFYCYRDMYNEEENVMVRNYRKMQVLYKVKVKGKCCG